MLIPDVELTSGGAWAGGRRLEQLQRGAGVGGPAPCGGARIACQATAEEGRCAARVPGEFFFCSLSPAVYSGTQPAKVHLGLSEGLHSEFGAFQRLLQRVRVCYRFALFYPDGDGRQERVVPLRQVVLAWGRGGEGQLGGSARSDSASPKVVGGSLKGRQILQVRAAGQLWARCCHCRLPCCGRFQEGPVIDEYKLYANRADICH